MAAELLEQRALLAVTATLVGGDLVIEYNAAGDLIADISSDGTKYTVTGTGLASKQFNVADVVGSITVKDLAAQAGQTFKVLAGTTLWNPLQVDGSVETTSLNGGILAARAGDVLIGSASISLADDISTAATTGNVIFFGAVTLAGNVAISTGSGAGNITFGSTLDGSAGGATETLGLTAGTGNIVFTGAVGAGERLGAITISSAADVTAAAIKAAAIEQKAGSGTTTLNGAIDTNSVAGVVLNGTALAINSSITTSNAGIVTINQSNTVTIAAAGDIFADGAVSVTAFKGISTAGDVTTTNDDVTLASATALTGNVALGTGAGGGNITFGSTLDGAKQLTLAAGTGAISFKGAVGSTQPLAGITLTSAGSTTADSTIKLTKAADSGTDGLTVAAGVNNVKMTVAGSSISGFAGNGVAFLGGSTNSQLGGFTVSGNGGNGMVFAAGSYLGTTIANNEISNNGDMVAHTGNGILVQGSDLMIGWDATATGSNVQNQISGNGLNGIEISGAGAVRNTILSNSIYLNGQGLTQVVAGDTVLVGKGIALASGGNGSQVAPTIYDVVRDSKNGKVRVQLQVPASGSYLVQLFNSSTADEQGLFPADPTGFQGRTFIGESPSGSPAPVGTGKPIISGVPVAGNTVAVIEVDASLVAVGNWITATATLLDGTTPSNTSGFSAGAQIQNVPTLAVGGDAPTKWSPDYAYQLVNQNELRVSTSNVQAAVKLHSYRNHDIVLAPATAAAGTTVVRTVASVTCVGKNVVRVKLKQGAVLPAGGGNFFTAPVSLPAARLYDAANGTPLLNVDAAQMVSALTDPTMVGVGGKGAATNAEATAFVSRFQGGMRVAAADVDGDGFVDLVTAPGVGGSSVRRGVFGDAPRIITIYSGNATGSWQSSSINVSGEAGLAAYAGGFQLALANVRPENTGSGNAPAELVVATSDNVFVYEIAVAARGARPVINPVVSQPPITTDGSITGLAAGSFTNPLLSDIVVATTTASQAQVMRWLKDRTRPSLALQRPASVTVYSAVASFAPTSTFTLGQNRSNGTQQQNIFISGASLTVGDVDNAPDQKPELILGAQSMGLANIRVLANGVVASGSQQAVDLALASGVNVPSRAPTVTVDGKQVWQPTGGPDFFTGMSSVPNAIALGANAPVATAVVDSDGNGRAEIFAALGATNSTDNVIRRIEWNGVDAWVGASTLAGPGTITVLPTPGSTKARFPFGRGLRLG